MIIIMQSNQNSEPHAHIHVVLSSIHDINTPHNVNDSGSYYDAKYPGGKLL